MFLLFKIFNLSFSEIPCYILIYPLSTHLSIDRRDVKLFIGLDIDIINLLLDGIKL
jgi:hypothetical protein